MFSKLLVTLRSVHATWVQPILRQIGSAAGGETGLEPYLTTPGRRRLALHQIETAFDTHAHPGLAQVGQLGLKGWLAAHP